jgi:cysteine-rich repeat protein
MVRLKSVPQRKGPQTIRPTDRQVNRVSGDGCSDTCQVEGGCGDGVVQAGEQCDDDNLDSGDGCDSSCRSEAPD